MKKIHFINMRVPLAILVAVVGFLGLVQAQQNIHSYGGEGVSHIVTLSPLAKTERNLQISYNLEDLSQEMASDSANIADKFSQIAPAAGGGL